MMTEKQLDKVTALVTDCSCFFELQDRIASSFWVPDLRARRNDTPTQRKLKKTLASELRSRNFPAKG